MGDSVRAAGGVVVREGDVVLVHRPRYDDWSLPKGKLHPGESAEEGALREVEEETGFLCRLVREVGSSFYVDHRGRRKVVRYWLMEFVSGVFVPHDEVDEIRWLAPADAAGLLTYERDRAVLESAA